VFYPTSGGQEHDTGTLQIDGDTYDVVDAMKVGPCVLHVINPPLPDKNDLSSWNGLHVHGQVNMERREQLRNNHTATHIVYSSCRKILGPHVWQNGAKKSVEQAHLDITHYQSLSNQEIIDIQSEANRVVQRCKEINKGFMPKDEAEKRYGFHLYQGGVVPGNELRVVNISDTDTEACCGTHCDNTAEVGTIKILKTTRMSDGIVRLYYVAGENAIKANGTDESILRALTQSWQIGGKDDIIPSASKFFDGYKKNESKAKKLAMQVLNLQMKTLQLDPQTQFAVFRTEESTPTNCITLVGDAIEILKEAGKGVAFVGPTYAIAILGKPVIDGAKLQQFIDNDTEQRDKKKKDKERFESKDKTSAPKEALVAKKVKVDQQDSFKKGKNVISGVVILKCLNLTVGHHVYDFFVENKFTPDRDE